LPVISYEVCDAYYVYITVELSGKSKVKAKKLFPDCAPLHLPHLSLTDAIHAAGVMDGRVS